MSASTGHPARVLFDSNYVPGMVTKLVLRRLEEQPGATFDPDRVADRFTELQCHGLAKLTEYLAEHPNLKEIGTGSIDLEGVTHGPVTLEALSRLQELYIGIPKRDVSPVTWLGYLADGMEEIPLDLRPILDAIANELAHISTKTRVGTVSDSFDEHFETKPYNALFD